MQVHRSLAFFLLAVAFAAAPGAASLAVERDGTWEIGPYLVYANFGDDLHFDNDIGWGGRAGYNLGEGNEIEVNLLQIGTDADFRGRSLDADFFSWTAGYLYNWTPEEQIVPFITAGGGAVKTSVEGRTRVGNRIFIVDTDDTSLSIYAGGGVRFYVTEVLNLRVDARWQWVNSDPDSTNNFVLTGGVGWTFGH